MKALAALFKRGFSHGIHPEELKDRTHALPTQRMPFVERYTLPLRQHLGAPAKPVVKVSQRVQRGQLIAEPGAFVSTALHSPVTGWVRAIGRRRVPDGRYEQAIEVEADRYATQRLGVQPPPHWRNLSLEDFGSLIQHSGIVGLGGASLPAHVKYALREGVKIKTFIANGAECEPYPDQRSPGDGRAARGTVAGHRDAAYAARRRGIDHRRRTQQARRHRPPARMPSGPISRSGWCPCGSSTRRAIRR